MASIRIVNGGDRELRRVIRGIDPETNPRYIRQALRKGGLLIQRNAARKQIKPGGKGPPERTRLTSRTGTGRRSIRVDRGGLTNFFVDIGSDLKYMQLHEVGGTVQRRQHTRQLAGGTLVTVRAHSATFGARPYLAPALDAVERDLEALFVTAMQREVDR